MFALARGVRGVALAEGREWSIEEIRTRAFDPWYRDAKARGFLRPNQTRDEYWAEFMAGYSLVERPMGDDVLTLAAQRAVDRPLPAEAQQFDDPKLQLLVALCAELQRCAGDQHFFLAVRTVQHLFGLARPEAGGKMLRMLVNTGILREAEKGGPHSMKATRFRYVPPIA